MAGYVAFSQADDQPPDVYDDDGAQALNPTLRFLKEVDKRTGYRTKQMLVAPILDGEQELHRRDADHQQQEPAQPFGALDEEGVAQLCKTLAIALPPARRSREQPPRHQVRLTWWPMRVLSAGELELACAEARKKAIDVEHVLMDEFQVKLAGDRRVAGQVLRRALRAVQAGPHQADGPAEEPQARVRRGAAGGFRSRSRQDGLVIMCVDPERGARRRASCRKVFPEAPSSPTASRTQTEFQETLAPVVRRRKSGRATSIDQLLADMDGGPIDDGSERRLAGVRRGRQRAGQARQQGHRRRLQPEASPTSTSSPCRARSRPASASARTARWCPTSRCRRIYRQAHGRAPQDHVRPRHLRAPQAAGRQDQVQEVRPARHRTARGDDPDRRRRRRRRDADPGRRRADPAGQAGPDAAQPGAARRPPSSKPYGLFFVCGPTGSGKTTTLHSVLELPQHARHQDLDRRGPGRDHPEGPAPGAGQPEDRTGPSPRRMRAFLRADPDVIMVGEMRDKETAPIGIEASLTGHLVFVDAAHQQRAGDRSPACSTWAWTRSTSPTRCSASWRSAWRKRLCSCKEAYTPEPAEIDLVPARVLRGAAEHRRASRPTRRRSMEAVYKDWVQALRQRQGPAHVLQAGRLRQVQRHRLQGPLRPARIADRLRPPEEADPGARARRRDAGDCLEEGMRTLKQDGMEKVPDGRDRHQGSTFGLHQVSRRRAASA